MDNFGVIIVWAGVWLGMAAIAAFCAALLHNLIPDGFIKRILYRRWGD